MNAIIFYQLIILSISSFMASCATLSFHHTTTLLPDQKDLRAKLWSYENLKDAFEVCQNNHSLDGGGPLKITLNSTPTPNLSMDWIYKNHTLELEVTDPVGATMLRVTADQNQAQLKFNHQNHIITINSKDRSTWSYEEVDLLINHRDLACLLSFGIPPAWYGSRGRWQFHRSLLVFKGRLANNHLILTAQPSKICTEIKKTSWLWPSQQLEICTTTRPHRRLIAHMKLARTSFILNWQPMPSSFKSPR